MIFILEKYPDTLEIKDVCEVLRIGKNTAYKLLQSGEIPSKRIKRKYIIPKYGLQKFLEKISLN